MLVTIGSVTTAARTAKIIRSVLGINVQVVRTPSSLNRGGCSYSIRFSEKYADDVKRIVAQRNIKVKKWYSETNGVSGRVYNDIS